MLTPLLPAPLAASGGTAETEPAYAEAEAGPAEEAAEAEPEEEEGVGRLGLPRTIAANRGERASSRVKVSAAGASECSSGQPGSVPLAAEEEEDGGEGAAEADEDEEEAWLLLAAPLAAVAAAVETMSSAENDECVTIPLPSPLTPVCETSSPPDDEALPSFPPGARDCSSSSSERQ